MYRIVALVSVVATLLFGGLASRVVADHVGNQQQPLGIAGVATEHPLVGAWYWQNISEDPFDDSYAIFHADGTYVEETTYVGAGIGSWQETGERTADLITVYQDIEGGLDPDAPDAFVAGTVRMWLAIEVDETGNAFSATGPVEIRSAEGALVDEFTFEGTATRLGVGWESR